LRRPCSNPECEELKAYHLEKAHIVLDGCHNFHTVCQSRQAKEYNSKPELDENIFS